MTKQCARAALVSLIVSLIGSTLIIGCSTSVKPISPAGPGTRDVEMAQWFDNVMVKAPPLLDSHWTRAEQDELLRRVGHADAASIGTIDVVTRSSFYQQRGRIGLLFRSLELLHGQLPKETLPLSLSAGQVGFDVSLLLDETPQRRLYLLLLKRSPKGKLRWVLYLPDELLIQHVRAMYEALSHHRS